MFISVFNRKIVCFFPVEVTIPNCVTQLLRERKQGFRSGGIVLSRYMEKMLVNFVPQKYKDCERKCFIDGGKQAPVEECKKRLMSCTVETGAQRA